ncbi:uncharacterized protein LOC129740039 [Uranotaenia lowii]|uniref:uncharacterized protein LOC129740039 n=1 Tax=Uranotaenia lowii TaxID=190385 RepID=UPI00247AAA02|nr:uncharacterized protein LOC129740039 [Uranotaenia lowii]
MAQLITSNQDVEQPSTVNRNFQARNYLFIVSRLDVTSPGIYNLRLSGAGQASKDVSNNDGLLSSSGLRNVNVSNDSSSSYSVTVKGEYALRHGIELLELGDPELEQRYDDLGSNEIELIPGHDSSRNAFGGLKKQKQTRNTNEQQILANGEGSEESGTLGRAAVQAITKVDIGANSQLNGARGSTIRIVFEVTNFRETPSFYIFSVNDELSFLRAMEPTSALLQPQQTVNVAVTMTIGPNAEIGARDKVTFRTEGGDRVTQAAWITVTDSAGLSDAYQPSIWYSYSSRCEGRSTAGTCTGAFWTVDITARDYETGLMRISSSPLGIIYKSPFTAGSRDEVKASYTASCCQPKVTISAHDVARNVRSINLDVTDIWLNEAGIAAVVLGILLFIALIVLLVLLIRWCIRRKRQQELPIYRGDARTTRRTT